MLKAYIEVCAACSLIRGVLFFRLYDDRGGQHDVEIDGLKTTSTLCGVPIWMWWRTGCLFKNCAASALCSDGTRIIGYHKVSANCPYLLQHLAAYIKESDGGS